MGRVALCGVVVSMAALGACTGATTDDDAGSPDDEDAGPPPCEGHNGGDGACVALDACSDGFALNADGHCVGVRAVGDLLQGRAAHSATLLGDDRVVVVGGFMYTSLGDVVQLNTTEIIDLDTSTARPGPELIELLTFHGAARHASGDVVLVGKQSGSVLTYWIDAETEELRLGPTLGRLRHNPIVVANSRGEVLAIGGDLAGTTELLDVEATRWTGIGIQLAQPFSNALWCHIDASRLLVHTALAFNTSTSTYEFPTTTVVIDIDALTLSPGPTLMETHFGGGCSALDDGRIVVFGGQKWSSTNNDWIVSTGFEVAASADAESFEALPLYAGEFLGAQIISIDSGRFLIVGSDELELPDERASAALGLIDLSDSGASLLVAGRPWNRRYPVVATVRPGQEYLVVGGSLDNATSARVDRVRIAKGFD